MNVTYITPYTLTDGVKRLSSNIECDLHNTIYTEGQPSDGYNSALIRNLIKLKGTRIFNLRVFRRG